MARITGILGQKDERTFTLGEIKAVVMERQTEEITVKSKDVVQEIYPSENKLISKVIVDSVTLDKPDQVKTTVPSKERQVVKPDAGYELAESIIEPIPDEYEIPVMYNGISYVLPTRDMQILHTAGKKVTEDITIEPIPEEYEDVTEEVQEQNTYIEEIERVLEGQDIGVVDVSDTTATAGDVLEDKEFYSSSGEKISGTIPKYTGNTLVVENGNLNTAGTYLEDDIVINVESEGGEEVISITTTADQLFNTYKGLIEGGHTIISCEFVDKSGYAVDANYGVRLYINDGTPTIEALNLGNIWVSRSMVFKSYDFDGYALAMIAPSVSEYGSVQYISVSQESYQSSSHVKLSAVSKITTDKVTTANEAPTYIDIIPSNFSFTRGNYIPDDTQFIVKYIENK